VVKKYTADTTKVLRNPLNGWVTYGSANPPANFWTHLDTMTVGSGPGTVRVADFSSTLYLRVSWSVLNPSEGVYGWDVDDTLRSVIINARERGMRLALRVVVDSRDKHESFSPDYVREAGAQGYWTQTGSATVWSPYPDDPVFQSKYATFVKQMAGRFDRPAEVDFVDGYGLGLWGEGHTLRYLDNANREAVFRWIVDLYSHYFGKVPLAMNYHRLIGTTKGWGAPDPNSRALLDYAFTKGYMPRQDAFGMTDYYGQWERDVAAAWRYRRPVMMEGGWITGQHNISNDPRGYVTAGDVRRGEYEDSAGAHVNTMDFRVGQVDSWFKDTPELVNRFVAEGGYRLRPVSVATPSAWNGAAGATITHSWANSGWGYCPNNLPQSNHKYKVAFALLDYDDHHVVRTFVDRAADPVDWRAGANTTYTFTLPATDAPKATYLWATAIVDTTQGNTPGLALAVKEVTTSRKWLPIGYGTIG
jgi:hypothetical protein